MNSTIQHKIISLSELQKTLLETPLTEVFQLAYNKNNWFIPSFSEKAIQSIIHQFLDAKKLTDFVSKYNLEENKEETVGIILAGNIPLVGFHDVLCAYLCNKTIHVKISSKDDVLTPFVLKKLMEIDKNSKIQFVDRIQNIDKIVATGSNNTYRYFEYYFKKYTNLLRKSRTSVAVISENEQSEALEALADDICMYFGFGCRNISHLFIPKDFDITRLFPMLEKKYNFFFEQQKWMNNYDYNRTILLMNSTPHLANNFIMLQENEAIFSPTAMVYYSTYNSIEELSTLLQKEQENIQCVVSNISIPNIKTVSLGTAQEPSLSDYADGIDTIDFLLK